MKAVLSALAIAVAGLLFGLLGLLLLKGGPHLTLDFLLEAPARAGRAGGILPVLVSTAWLLGGAMALALPLGVGTAIWLQEYAPAGRMAGGPGAGIRGLIVLFVEALIEALAGVPSIIFGLFGFSLFVMRLGWGWSLASGSATLALMLLPTVIRTAQEALAGVPGELREGALALGATRWEALRRVGLKVAAPGILTGAMLALGRALGETAAVMLTAGSDLGLPGSPLDPGRSLAVHLYILASEGLSEGRTYATALVLVAAVLLVNLVAQRAIKGRQRL